MPETSESAPLPPLVGGRYRVQSLLGRGATSTVHRAHDEHRERPVALKVMHRGPAADREMRAARFTRQAELASRVRHSGLVEHYDAATTGDDTYVVTELVVGESLAARVGRDGAIDLSVATRLLRPVMSAIAALHGAGIVHRDVKPENLLISAVCDAPQRSVLIDFGLARAVGDRSDRSPIRQLVGTPFYMSPEQASGMPDLSPACDVWAMGVVLYRVLSGDLPFTGRSPAELLDAIIGGEHDHLGARAPWLPRSVTEWVEGALVADPQRRYRDMIVMEQRAPLEPTRHAS